MRVGSAVGANEPVRVRKCASKAQLVRASPSERESVRRKRSWCERARQSEKVCVGSAVGEGEA